MLAVTSGSMSAQQNKTQDLPLSVIPSTLCIPHERAAYLLVHIWDDIDFADTLRSHHPAFMEQSLVNFLSLFPHAQAEARIMAVKSLMQRAEVDETAYRLLARLAEKHLCTSGSPMQNEEYFIPFLEEIVGTSLLDETEKSRSRFLLSAALKNRPGTMATTLLTSHLTVNCKPYTPSLLPIGYCYCSTIPIVYIVGKSSPL